MGISKLPWWIYFHEDEKAYSAKKVRFFERKIEDTIGQGWMRNSPDVYNRSIEVGRRWIRQLCVRHLLVISPHHISQVRTVEVRDRKGWPVHTIRRPAVILYTWFALRNCSVLHNLLDSCRRADVPRPWQFWPFLLLYVTFMSRQSEH